MVIQPLPPSCCSATPALGVAAFVQSKHPRRLHPPMQMSPTTLRRPSRTGELATSCSPLLTEMVSTIIIFVPTTMPIGIRQEISYPSVKFRNLWRPRDTHTHNITPNISLRQVEEIWPTVLTPRQPWPLRSQAPVPISPVDPPFAPRLQIFNGIRSRNAIWITTRNIQRIFSPMPAHLEFNDLS
jgi:hypothetical protein